MVVNQENNKQCLLTGGLLKILQVALWRHVVVFIWVLFFRVWHF